MRNVTRNARRKRMTIEALWADCLDVRELQRRRMFDENWVRYSAGLRCPKIAALTVARYVILLELRGQGVPRRIRISWTKVHVGGERPWFHCPRCEKRVAKLYRGLGGYFCRACVGNPPYASQTKSAQGRAHYQACKLRLLLNGEADISAPFPNRPHRMHRHKYGQLARRLQKLEDGLSERLKKKVADYPSLVAYFF
jgi:hypothetical protein